jgi:hypothetical protein
LAVIFPCGHSRSAILRAEEEGGEIEDEVHAEAEGRFVSFIPFALRSGAIISVALSGIGLQHSRWRRQLSLRRAIDQ